MIEHAAPGPAPETVRLLTWLSDQELLRLLDHPEEMAELRAWGVEPPTPEHLRIFIALKTSLQHDLAQFEQERERIAAWHRQRKQHDASLEQAKRHADRLATELAQVRTALEARIETLQQHLEQAKAEQAQMVPREREALRHALDHELAIDVAELNDPSIRAAMARGSSVPPRIATEWEAVGLTVAIADALGISVAQLARNATLREVITIDERALRRRLAQVGYRCIVSGTTFGLTPPKTPPSHEFEFMDIGSTRRRS